VWRSLRSSPTLQCVLTAVAISSVCAGCSTGSSALGAHPAHHRSLFRSKGRLSTRLSSTGDDWTVYHHDPRGTGDASAIDLSPAHLAWISPALDGQLYGEPLVSGGTIVVATENDTIYALDAATGHLRWATQIGMPVPAAALPCGDIRPWVGITATPVIDPARQEVFAVADEDRSSGPVHQLVGLSLRTGAILLRQDVDPPNADAGALLQRTALALDRGHVVFGYGGNYGDCSNYHGWVVSVPETGGPMTTYEVDSAPGESKGAIWMGGAAPIIDAKGHIWVAVGNGSVTSEAGPYDGSEAVLELSTSLRRLQYFAPADWAGDNATDRDLGSAAPVLLGNGFVLQAGKSQTLYLLSAKRLGGVGGQLAEISPFCADDVDGGSAISGAVAFLPCRAGVEAVATSASLPALRVEWQTPSGSGGPPILAGGEVWTINQSGVLFGLDPSSGAVEQRFPLGAEDNHFPTPSSGDGLLLAPSADRVYAFAGP